MKIELLQLFLSLTEEEQEEVLTFLEGVNDEKQDGEPESDNMPGLR